MIGETAVAMVIALASSMGVGGAAWLLMFRPLGQVAEQKAQVPAARPQGNAPINWAGR